MAEALKGDFIHNQSWSDTIDTTAQLENKAEATLKIFGRFLVYVADISEDQLTHACTALLLNVFKYLNLSCGQGLGCSFFDIHFRL